jgi:hypothetical protein
VLVGGGHLVVLSAFALAQPLFDVLGRNAEFFAVRGSTTWDVVLFALGATLVPPLVLLAVELLAFLADRRLQQVLHLVFVAAAASVFFIQLLQRQLGISSTSTLIAAAIVLGSLLALGYVRARGVRAVFTVLLPAPAAFLVLFLFASPVSDLLFAGDPGPRSVAVHSRTPVVLVVFDELSTTSLLDENGEIDAARYPSFADLANEGTWFRNAASVDAWTTNAVPAILTGVLPEHGRLPIVSQHPDNLFTLLGGDYRLHVAESLTQLCPAALCPEARPSFLSRMDDLVSDTSLVYLHLVLPRELRRRLPSVSDTWGAFLESSHERTRRRLTLHRDFVASLTDGERPTLAFEHLMFPHLPWEFLPSGHRYEGGDLPGFETNRWSGDSFLVEQAYQRYLLQLGYADRLLGDVLARLRSEGLYDRSLVIVVADHGVSFHPGGRRRAFTAANLDDVVFVPLLVKRPGQREGAIDDDPVQTIDILPTIAAALGIDIPWRVDGEPLFGPRTRERFVFVGDRDTFTGDPAAVEARRAASLERQISLFGSGGDEPGLYGIGPHANLLGRPVDDLATSQGGSARAHLDQAADLRHVDLRNEEIPVRLTGAVSRAGSAPRDLAVAVGGRIVATARSYSFAGGERFSVLVPEAALRQGLNQVQVFSIEPGPVLTPLLAG